MKKKLTLIAIVSFFCITSISNAEMYVSGKLGAAFVSDADYTEQGVTLDMKFEVDTGYTVSGAIGNKFKSGRIEGEVAYQSSEIDQFTASAGGASVSIDTSGDVSVLSFLVNGYYDFILDSKVSPYIGGGIGFAQISTNDITLTALGQSVSLPDQDDTVFAWQIGAGIGYALNDKLALDLGYRFFTSSDAEFDGGSKIEFASHNFTAGLRYSF